MANDYRMMARKFGEVEFNGKTYALTCQADYSNGVLDGVTNYNDADEGDDYQFEMVATAIDSDGERYNVRWIFDAIKGAELPLEDLTYSIADGIEAV